MRALSVLLPLMLGIAASPPLAAQPLPQRVLIIYNSNAAHSAASLEVAEHYRTTRGIPAANLCPVNFPDPLVMYYSQWPTYKTAIRNCLNAVGPSNILYVVLSYKVPSALYQPPSPGVALGTAALDSYISDIWDRYSTSQYWTIPTNSHPYYQNIQSQGGVYTGFTSFAAYRSSARALLFYSVFRLGAVTGSTKDAAKAMVTKAINTENAGGLDVSGNVYIDRRFGFVDLANSTDQGYYAGDMDLLRARDSATAAGLTVVDDGNEAEIGYAPAPLTAPNAILFCGWYNMPGVPLGTYLTGVFGWRDGAVGWHLDSNSSQWSDKAITDGVTVTTGALYEPYLEGMVHPDGAFRDLLAGANVGDAFLRNSPWLRWNVIHYGDPLYRPFPGGRAPFNAPLTSYRLQLNAQNVVGGKPAQGVLTIPSPAPVGGSTFQVTSPGLASAPATVTVPAGLTTANFAITTSAVASPSLTNLFRIHSGATQVAQNTLRLYPWLAQVGATLSSVTGGTGVTGFAGLYDTAPMSGIVVSLTSSHPAVAQVPASITVSAGTVAKTFPITTSAVGAQQVVTITAAHAGTTVQFNLTVKP